MKAYAIALGVAVSLLLPAALLARDAGDAVVEAGIQLLLVDGVREFPEATEVGAIRFACAESAAPLRGFFAQRGVPFREALIRRRQSFKFCHVFYEPTVPGFRAMPDNQPVTGLVTGLDPASLVGGRKKIGDSLDVARDVLRQIERPLDITFAIPNVFDRSYWPAAVARVFAGSIHAFTLIESEADGAHPWGQDVVKGGVAGGRVRLLTPRRLFEGRAGDGELFRPLLDAFHGDRYVRSKLSWEGGDLQIITDPRNAARTILFHGGASHGYWGAGLKPDETSYILQLELGADAAIDLSRIGPHADYLVAFLPDDNTVLVARPVVADLDLAWAASLELLRLFEDRAPNDLKVLERILRQAQGPDAAPESLEHARSRVRTLLSSLPTVLARVPEGFHERLEAHQARFCPEDATQCYLGEGKRVMLREDPDLLRSVYNVAAEVELEPLVSIGFLRLIDSQLPNDPIAISGRIDEQVAKIKKLGFRVVRVPYLYSPEARDEWPGISYTNSLLVDKQLFVPAAGLGAYEEKVFREMQKKLPQGYRVVPVYARFGLMNNGGVHCVFGVIRDPGGV